MRHFIFGMCEEIHMPRLEAEAKFGRVLRSLPEEMLRCEVRSAPLVNQSAWIILPALQRRGLNQKFLNVLSPSC
jgi:hypothetical protein